MRLVLATPLYPPEIGGPATYAKALVEGLTAYGIEIELIKFGDVRHLPKVLRHYTYYRRVLRALKKADAVLALDPVSVGLPAMLAAKKLKKPFVVKIVGDYAWEQGRQRFGVTQDLDAFVKTRQPSWAVRMLQQKECIVAAFAKKIIVPSSYLKNVVTAWGIPSEKIEVIYNGVSIPDNLPEIERPKGFVVVSSGRRVPWKGFEALERVVAREQDWHFHLVSGVPRREALAWVKSADVFVLNSAYEGLSHALIEALLVGTPVIATRAGGNSELIEHNVSGVLVAPGNDEELYAALRAVAEGPSEARKRAAVAQERMHSLFSVSTMLEKTAELVKKL